MDYRENELRKLQLTELEILEAIDEVCIKNGIDYWIDSGTVLGAVRHGGFIPWDDDIDIGMLRDDYEKFLSVAPAALGGRYVVSSPHSNQHQAAMFAKVMIKGTSFKTAETEDAGFNQGIFVDVLPYDSLSDNRCGRFFQRFRCFFWQSISYLRCSGHVNVPHKGGLGAVERAICKMANRLASRLLTSEAVRSHFERAALSHSEESTSKYLHVMPYAMTEPFLRKTMVPPKPIAFEGRTFFGPAEPEAYLEALYGKDWRELPPIEERRNHAPIELGFGERG